MTKEARGKGGEGIGKIRNADGEVIEDEEEMVKVWGTYFGELAEPGKGRAVITCMGMERGGGRIQPQEDIKREEVENAIRRLNMGKAAGIDGITAEMLKYGGEEMISIMHRICQMAWEQGRVPGDWKKAVIVPIYKGKRSVRIGEELACCALLEKCLGQ